MAEAGSKVKKKRLSDAFLKGSGWGARATYLMVRLLFALLQIVPIEQGFDTARFVVRIWKIVLPRHRKLAIAHLRESYKDEKTPADIERIADECLESVVMFAMELVAMPRRINAFTWSRYIELNDFDGALRVFLENRGAILVTGHYGSFEIMGHLIAALGFDMVAVMRPLDNEFLNRFVVESRGTHGLTLLDKKGAAAHAEDYLKSGALVGFIGDQDAGRKGTFVHFFGRPASTYKSIALLAMSVNLPVIVGYARRIGRKPRYKVGVERIIHPHDWALREDPLRWVTQEYTSAIESIIRADPGQYLWIHKRWKSQPRTVASEASQKAVLRSG